MIRRILLAAVVVASAFIAGGCAGSDSDADAPDGRYLTAQLCAAAADAESGDVEEARRRFEDVHTSVHTLADGMGDTDRARAGEILRAKQRVEDALDEDENGELAAYLEALATAIGGSGGCS